MRAMKKDPTFKPQKSLKIQKESTELAIDKREFLFHRLYEKQPKL